MQSFYLLFHFLDRLQFTISYSLIFHVCEINTFFSLSLSLQKSTGRMCDNEMVLIQYKERRIGGRDNEGERAQRYYRVYLSENWARYLIRLKTARERQQARIDCLKDNRKTNGQHSLSVTGDFVIQRDVIWLSYFTDICSLSLDDRL